MKGTFSDTPASYTVEAAFPCWACGRVYRRMSTLQRHVRYECGKEPQFACQWCPYRAKQKSNLATHCRMLHPLAQSEKGHNM
ncbi:Adult enhancer factor 1 [Gryllus bimaculatus]|nr:Adult enhancer factor 1 [Gryllus bimaculatus]